ncbi:MAG: hypothetical protein ACRYG8_45870, partial [Janthinobacterium lividum]
DASEDNLAADAAAKASSVTAFERKRPVADYDDRAQPFRYDGAQHSDMIAIRSEHPVDVKLVASTGACVNR